MNAASLPSVQHERSLGLLLTACLHAGALGALFVLIHPVVHRQLISPVQIELVAPQAAMPAAPPPSPTVVPRPLPAPPVVTHKPKTAPPKPAPDPIITSAAPAIADTPSAPPPSVEKTPPSAAVHEAPPPSPATTSATQAKSETVQAARFDADYLHNPAPAYPATSRRLHEEGKVVLNVQVATDGSATQVLIDKSSGYARLDSAARDAVVRWRFVPARLGQQTVADWVKVPIVFELKS